MRSGPYFSTCPALIGAVLFTLPLLAGAGVNPRNGNFYITYEDAKLVNKGHTLEIVRTYNSKSTSIGWFGFGWGSKYETRLVVLPDGSVAVHENGAGRVNYYRVDSGAAVRAGVDRIVEAVTPQEKLTPTAASALAHQLLNDEELRLQKVERYGIRSELPLGTALDDFCGKATLVRIPEGYRRQDCGRFGDAEPATDTFDRAGRLVRHETDDGYVVTIDYAKPGAVEIRDTTGQSARLDLTPQGRVNSLRAGNIEVRYRYDERQDLLLSDTMDGLSYRYAYDANHNMTRITYIDDSSMFISYSPRVSGMADAVTTRTGDIATYAYGTDPSNPKRYWTRVTTVSPTGASNSQEYEYEDQVSPTGANQLARIARTTAGGTTETAFDDEGRIKRDISAGDDRREYVYHPKSGKLILSVDNQLSTQFHYDDQGNLLRAANSKGQTVLFDYGREGRIQRMRLTDVKTGVQRDMKYKYGRDGLLSEVFLAGSGTISVMRDASGEIREINSPKGGKIALQLTQAFQDLLAVVRVAGARY